MSAFISLGKKEGKKYRAFVFAEHNFKNEERLDSGKLCQCQKSQYSGLSMRSGFKYPLWHLLDFSYLTL